MRPLALSLLLLPACAPAPPPGPLPEVDTSAAAAGTGTARLFFDGRALDLATGVDCAAGCLPRMLGDGIELRAVGGGWTLDLMLLGGGPMNALPEAQGSLTRHAAPAERWEAEGLGSLVLQRAEGGGRVTGGAEFRLCREGREAECSPARLTYDTPVEPVGSAGSAR
ncbi:hypothetical protein [Wenxinia saemankumensis]|uniref:Lipoprotein n=1 Tax=Wenxinia saemankumensis TaxID=1447782 RepID=A0A1M6GNR3_9RHOB|nr:hypothetical protein [Wenxinia saemankumensis]SHJ11625.1 hypothetical protein SAMN05444417_2833 [Wenxinia saemankumensis]